VAAARAAAGSAIAAVDLILDGEIDNAFCAVRPPGHHAERQRPMGFCLFNSVAIGALHALQIRGLERVAVLDFDVHHGNGTQDIFIEDPRVLYLSSHQMPLYPGTGAANEIGVGNIVNAPLYTGSGADAFRDAWSSRLIPALREFEPQMLVISAGFDAHRLDPLAGLGLDTEDFRWLTEVLMREADDLCGGRLVSSLEGGYHHGALAESASAHVQTLMTGGRSS
jgi:acetoin utilization deacetylase AcuC-like enzyme